jgi:hypothetical protein
MVVLPCSDIPSAGGLVDVAVCISAPEMVYREARDICCVIDVSGSMSDLAPIENDDGESSNAVRLTILELVLHAVKAVMQLLTAEDRLVRDGYFGHTFIAFICVDDDHIVFIGDCDLRK